MSNKLGISTSKGYNDKFSEVSSMDFGIGTIIISNWDLSTLGTFPKVFTKKKMTFYLPDGDSINHFKTAEPDTTHVAINGTFIYLGRLDGSHFWQKVAE